MIGCRLTRKWDVAHPREPQSYSLNERVVPDFIEAWSRLDPGYRDVSGEHDRHCSVFDLHKHPRRFADAAIDYRVLADAEFRPAAGTVLGAADYTFFSNFNWSGNNRYVIRNGDYVQIPRSQWPVLPMEEQFDAVLYLSPPLVITFEELSPTLCEDPDYLKMRLDRMALTPFPDQSLQRLCEGLEQE